MPTVQPACTALRRFALALSTVAALAVAGCAAPLPGAAKAAPAAGSGIAPAGTAPAVGVADGPAVEIDRSCSTDAECTVKDIGNCCGYYPACVNVDSPTDPEGVKAQCAKSGMASVCGFPAITRCQCVAGQCEGSSQALLE